MGASPKVRPEGESVRRLTTSGVSLRTYSTPSTVESPAAGGVDEITALIKIMAKAGRCGSFALRTWLVWLVRFLVFRLTKRRTART